MAWEFNTDIPIYLQLMDIIKYRIVSGYYKPGDKIEAVRVLACEAAVNPNTMQKALSELEREGLMYSNRTNGRYITDDLQLLDNLKNKIAEDKWNSFILGLTSLGWDKNLMSDFIKKRLDEILIIEKGENL